MKKNQVILGGLLFVSTGAFATLYHGSLEVLVFDDFQGKKSKTVYQLKQDDKLYELQIPSTVDTSRLLTGVKVQIEGTLLPGLKNNDKIKVQHLNIQSRLKEEAIPSSPRRLLTILVNFTDKKATTTVSESTVNSMLYTANDSMVANYTRSSFNQVSFIPDTNQNGKPDIYTVNLNYAAGTACNYSQWATDAKAAVINLGVNTSPYQHIMLVLPRDVKCAWGGLGYLGCSGDKCYTWVVAHAPSYYGKGVYAHELGHNLGLKHAGIDANNDGTSENDYGDDTCFMGTNFKQFPELNAPHRDQMQWFNAYPNSLKTLTTNGTYTLQPLETGVANNKLVVLKFLKKDTSQYYYLSYRINSGPFGYNASNLINTVSVHKAANTGITYLIQTLGKNQTFTDAANKISVKVTDITGANATVQVNLTPQQEQLVATSFYQNDNTSSVGYNDWDPNYWKGNCPPYAETVGLSSSLSSTNRPSSIACIIKDSSTSTATGKFVRTKGGIRADDRTYKRNGDWDYGYLKWECGLNEYVSGFSQSTRTPNSLHKIRCASGTFTNGGKDLCETRFVGGGKDDRGSTLGGDWDPNYYKGQCSDGKIIFGVSLDLSYKLHKILCCKK